ncbi:hypothetical protein [Lysobacter sp. CA199]|uniref:hypothetical protein n=1 Tax=Lysobacter sp. CA199 TaxID=3455608 RepID=UPI003F8D66CD
MSDTDSIVPVSGAAPDPGADDAAKLKQNQDRAQCRKWQKKVKAALDGENEERKRWPRWRSYAKGNMKDAAGAEYAVDAPILKSVLETQLAQLYAKNPEVASDPVKSVGAERDESIRAFAETIEIAETKWFKDAKVKPAVRRAIRAAQVVPVGVLKLSLQIDKRRDPVIQRRMNDLQDNIARIETLQRQLDDPNKIAEHEEKAADLRQQLRAVSEQADPKVRKGFVLDPITLETWVVDPGCSEIIDHLNAGWQANFTWMQPDDVMDSFGLTCEQVDKLTRYNDRKADSGPAAKVEHQPGSGDPQPGWIRVWELWCKTDTTVYTFGDGFDEYLREPYTPDHLSARFYPYFVLGFNWLDAERWPQSTVEGCHKLQDEYSTTRSRQRLHRKRAIPKTAFNAGAVPPTEAKKVEQAETGEMVGVHLTDPDADLSKLLVPISYPNIDPALYDVGPILRDLEQLVGLQDAARSTMVKAKTATEATIMDNSSTGRGDSQRENVEELVNDIACAMLEIGLSAYTAEEMARIAGPKSIWPKYTRDEIFDIVDVAVRAGTSGRPDTAAEREAWATLLPLLMQMIERIALAASNPMLAASGVIEAYTELLRESFRRLDERIDVDRFLPKAVALPPLAVPGAGAPGVVGPAGVPVPNPAAVPALAAAAA